MQSYYREQRAVENFFKASKSGNLAEVKRNYEICPSVINSYSFDKFSYTGLQFAAENGYLEICQFLCEKKVDINIANNPPLHLASKNGHLNVCKYLVSKGADINKENLLNRFVPLQVAALNFKIDICLFFLNEGVDVNSASIQNGEYTALHLASMKNCFIICRVLLEFGADKTMLTRELRKAKEMTTNQKIIAILSVSNHYFANFQTNEQQLNLFEN
eukprot:TRINITY_DN703_c1_g1_i2.p1 TRINITY_DN703_c1_g1~~TRINITY_DN703_c1_g1_i2.p1  ORF type:complete len:231 (-),score=70.76 TRINITY_DN703_c1_g1_i2:67-717(-)